MFEHLPLPKEGYYYDQNTMANPLSLGQIANEFTVKMNTAIDDVIYVYDKDGKYIRFARTKAKLYCAYLHPNDGEDKCYLTTVKDRKAMFSEADCRRAEAVRNLESRLGHPLDVDLANAMEYNVLGPCDFNRRDIRIAYKIFGPSAAALKGKTTNSKSKMKVQEEVTNNIPDEILKEYGDVHVDIMYVNKIAFFTAISRNIELIHYRAIANRDKKRIKDAVQELIKEYAKRGFIVKTIHGDNKFAPLKSWLIDEHKVDLETCDTDAHVLVIERTNHFLKERINCTRLNMPFQKIPRRFMI